MHDLLETEKTKEYPLLVGFLANDGRQVKVWCPFCKKWHYHGVDAGMFKRKGSHRVEHCHPIDSVFSDTGYFIRIIYKKEKSDMIF
jgi:hypothetical protein